MDWGRRGVFISSIHVSMERMPRIVLLLSHSRMSLHGGVFHCGPEKKCIYFVTSGPCSRDRNQWSFDMFFAQESFKNALFLMILVCMDRAQSEELGTLYFCRCQMYIS